MDLFGPVLSFLSYYHTDNPSALRSFQNKDAIVAKLFAKHIKLDEAKQFLKRSRVNIGVGTPMRIIDLIESGGRFSFL